MRRINRGFPLIVLATLAIPFLAGFAWGGTLDAGLEALLWAGLVRIFLVHHITWSINSICHFFGARRFETGDYSTNVFWLALPSLGEAWHHNHHAFPALRASTACAGTSSTRRAGSSWRWRKVGLAWDVVLIDREAQLAKLQLAKQLGRAPRAPDPPTDACCREHGAEPRSSRACAASRTSGASSSRSPAAPR